MNHEFLSKMSGLFTAVLGEVARSVFTMKSVPFLSATKENIGCQKYQIKSNNNLKCVISVLNIRILNFKFIFRNFFWILYYMYRYVQNKCNLVTHTHFKTGFHQTWVESKIQLSRYEYEKVLASSRAIQ